MPKKHILFNRNRDMGIRNVHTHSMVYRIPPPNQHLVKINPFTSSPLQNLPSNPIRSPHHPRQQPRLEILQRPQQQPRRLHPLILLLPNPHLLHLHKPTPHAPQVRLLHLLHPRLVLLFKRHGRTPELRQHLLVLALCIAQRRDGPPRADRPRILRRRRGVTRIYFNRRADDDAEVAAAADVEVAEDAGVDAAAGTGLECLEEFAGALFRGARHAAGGEGLREGLEAERLFGFGDLGVGWGGGGFGVVGFAPDVLWEVEGGVGERGWDAFDDGYELEDSFVFFDLHELGDLDVSCAVDAVELVADEIDDHEVLRTFFLG